MIPAISENLMAIANLEHGFTHRKLTQEERDNALIGLQLLKQVHGDRLVWITNASAEKPEADAIATLVPGVKIGVQSADCVPLLFAAIDSAQQAVGILAIHAGWRGTQLRITEKSLLAFSETLRAESIAFQEIRGVVGPCISSAAYEVGEEVAQFFSHKKPIANPSPSSATKFLLDLARENLDQAHALSVRIGKKISCSTLGSCTFSQPDMYPSFRRDGARPDRIISYLSFRR